LGFDQRLELSLPHSFGKCYNVHARKVSCD
jgi:hypothetical protein